MSPKLPFLLITGFEGDISPSARIQKYITRAEIFTCLSARLTEIDEADLVPMAINLN